MNFSTKLIVSFITIMTATVSGIWGAYEVLDLRMDHKVKEGEEKVMTYIMGMKSARDAEIKGMDSKFVAEVTGMKTQLNSMDNKLNILIGMNRPKQVVLIKNNSNTDSKN